MCFCISIIPSVLYKEIQENGKPRVRQSSKVFCKSVKKFFIKISQNSQENACVGVSFFRPATLLNEKLRYRCFPLNVLRIFREHPFNRTFANDCLCKVEHMFEMV